MSAPVPPPAPQAQGIQPLGILAPTFASNPGNVRLNPLRWWRFQPMGAILGGGFAAITFAVWLGLTLAGMKGSIPTKDGGETPIWVFGVASLATVALYTWLAARKFHSGDANPGVVVALNPTLIAVPTDLSQGEGVFPAVKILKINLATAGGEPITIGARVPTVATYAAAPNKEAGHWGDFYPFPAEYATGDPNVLRRLLDSFPEAQYDFLNKSLARIDQPYRTGLYAMWEAPGKPVGRRIARPVDF